MKTRTGFVSNSSSASFVIARNLLTPAQIEGLLAYAKSSDNEDGWRISDDGNYIDGWTSMDNEAIWPFMEKLGIAANLVRSHNF